MSGSTTGIVAIYVVAVIALVTLVLLVRRAANHPAQEHAQHDEQHGLVQGGQHVGGGRSVAPTRDAPVPEGGGKPPTVEEQEAAREAQNRRGPEGTASPMDL